MTNIFLETVRLELQDICHLQRQVYYLEVINCRMYGTYAKESLK